MRRSARAIRFTKAVGKKGRAARVARNLGQEDLAKKLQSDAPTISRIEAGKRALRLHELYDYASALGVSPADLVNVEQS